LRENLKDFRGNLIIYIYYLDGLLRFALCKIRFLVLFFFLLVAALERKRKKNEQNKNKSIKNDEQKRFKYLV